MQYQAEESILKKVNINNKIPQYKISEQVKNGNIKLFLDNEKFEKIETNKQEFFILKISGIWETTTHYGLTYKFTVINKFYPSVMK